MAMFIEGMPCPLCQQPLLNEPIFGTWGVWLPASDRLVQYCDAAMHWDCYAKWKYRERFSRSYFDFWVQHEKHDPYWHCSYLDEYLLVTVNPSSQLGYAWVYLAATGSRRVAPLSQWEEWLHATDDADHEVELVALESAKSRLRRERPTVESLFQCIQPESKTEIFRMREEEDRKRAAKEADFKREVAEYNSLCDRVIPVILKSGYRCAACRKSKDFRLATSKEKRSLIICRNCGETVDPKRFETAVSQDR